MILYKLIRILLFPWFRYFFPLVSSRFKKRLDFELRNPSHQTLPESDLCFEVSSEGELEQVISLIRLCLTKEQKVQILFCSESVEKRCLELQEQYSKHLTIYRLPILTYLPGVLSPYQYIKAKRLFMCRYDLFPELIDYGRKLKDFILISGTLKNFKQKKAFEKQYLEFCYLSFQKIVAATKRDEEAFRTLGQSSVESFDFRAVSILARQKNARTTILEKYPKLISLIEYFEKRDKDSRIIFGSFWNNEAPIFDELMKAKDFSDYFVIPHKLQEEEVQTLIEKLREKKAQLIILDEELDFENLSRESDSIRIWVLPLRGILCELYIYFSYCYIGGGFGESIHSVLEPYCAQNSIICGPKIQRSTEFALIESQSPHKIKSVDQYEFVLQSFSKMKHQQEKVEADYSIDELEISRVTKWLGM